MKKLTFLLVLTLIFANNLIAQDSTFAQKEIVKGINAYDNEKYEEAFRLLFKNQNDKTFTTSTQVKLGIMYSNGSGVKQNFVEALKCYRKAAELGNSDGQFNLGLSYKNGEGVTINNTEAIKWFQKAADQGNTLGQNSMGVMYEYGLGVTKNIKEAVRFYSLSAKQNYTKAKTNLTRLGYNEDGELLKEKDNINSWTDEQRATFTNGCINSLKKANWGIDSAKSYCNCMQIKVEAKLSVADAATKLTPDEIKKPEWVNAIDECMNGNKKNDQVGGDNTATKEIADGTKAYFDKNYTEAFRLLSKNKESNNFTSDAQIILGIMQFNGSEGVTQNYSEAVKCFRKAAEQGNAMGQYNLGYAYSIGKGVEKNNTETINWYQKSAEQGYAEAQYNLGVEFENGSIVEKDFTKAFQWYKKAAEQGIADAQNNLGLMYSNGEGLPVNFTEALKWYTKAASQGSATGQFNLGISYENGEGVVKDINEAVRYYRLAAKQGYDGAKERLKKLGYSE